MENDNGKVIKELTNVNRQINFIEKILKESNSHTNSNKFKSVNPNPILNNGGNKHFLESQKL
jgi:hypothetical protein